MENVKVIPFKELGELRDRHPGKRIVHCHGVFDLLHYGHVLHLQSAKKFGDILVVTVTSDAFVNKGPGSPHYPEFQRAFMLAQLTFIDYVSINQNPTAVPILTLLKPHFYVKGSDYRLTQKDLTGGILEEENAVEAVGGELVFTDDDRESSTQLINQYFSRWDDDQSEAIERIKKTLKTGDLLGFIEGFSKAKVLVVGEPIVDSYVFCQPDGLASKSASIAARFLKQEDYTGGSLAIANHLASIGCEVTLLITHGGEPYFLELLKESLNPSVKLHAIVTQGVPTVRKTRYLMPFRQQRIFELTHHRSDQWQLVDPKPFAKAMRDLAAEHDLTIVADFGHGIFEGHVLESMQSIPGRIALNVQTNSGNFGFNPFTKHNRFDYLSIDERECRLALHDRFTPIEILARKAVSQLLKRNTSITLGTVGSLYFDAEGQEHLCPTFFKDVIDTVGAGDAYFAITSILVQQGAPGAAIPFLGNCFAGLKTRIIGNKKAVAKVDLIRTVQAILA